MGIVVFVETFGTMVPPRRPAWALAALLMTLGLSEGLTQTIKMVVHRKRPNFYALCGFDPTATTPTCRASANAIREAQWSFPSGHSSLSACSAVFLMWYLVSKVMTVPQQPQQRRLWWWTVSRKRMVGALIVAVGIGWTMVVGISRLVDHWHHPSDVLAGWCLGSLVATTVFHLYYYPLWHSQVGLPLG
jgi:diacylglycerol diphosphate phosphatase / phosphatidate phosphatase